MSQGKKGTSNYRWPGLYSRYAIKFLAEMATQGFKVDKRPAFQQAADAVTKKFKVNPPMKWDHVENHLKTLKKRWEIIDVARNNSESTFDDVNKVINMGRDKFWEYIKAHPKAEPYINKPIELYEELRAICGMQNSELQNGVKSRKGIKNFRWTPAMSRFLILFLFEQVKSGGKVHKTFRREELEGAAQAVNEKFKLRITEANVENHLKTVRVRYAQIKRLRTLNGVKFNETEKKIVMEEGAYAGYVEAHPQDEQYLNKSIDLYDEMAIICDPEYTTESSFKDCTENIAEDTEVIGRNDADLAVDEYIEVEDMEEGEQLKTIHLSTSNGSTTRAKRNAKRSRRLRNCINNLALQIREVAEAIRSRNKGISSELFTEVMKCEGYDEALLEKAFDYLNEHENLARAFIVKNQRMRQAWLFKFFSDDASVR